MALLAGQVQVRDLVMGPGTPYSVQGGFNPWTITARVDQSSPRSWDNGSWSGAEWRDEVVIPIPVLVQALDGTVDGWTAAHQDLAAAFGPSHIDIELRWRVGSDEWVMFGRPRLVEPDPSQIALGMAHTQCAFVALDPKIYAGLETVLSTGLPSTSGGLTWPVTWPVTWNAVVTSGVLQAVNAGKTATRPRLVIYGPCSGPRVTLTGTGESLAWNLTLTAGQWLDVDTDRRTSLLNGQVSRSGQMTSRQWFELLPGISEIAFGADAYTPDASLVVAYRSAW